MKKYRRQQLFVTLFLLGSLVIGIAGHFTPRHEIFPLFSWFLFSMVPQKTMAYDILIQERPGRVYDPPVSYQQAPDAVAAPHSIVSYRIIQELGRAREKRDAAGTARLRGELEARFTSWPVRYELVKLTFDDPLERWKTGRPGQSELLESFVSGQSTTR